MSYDKPSIGWHDHQSALKPLGFSTHVLSTAGRHIEITRLEFITNLQPVLTFGYQFKTECASHQTLIVSLLATLEYGVHFIVHCIYGWLVLYLHF